MVDDLVELEWHARRLQEELGGVGHASHGDPGQVEALQQNLRIVEAEVAALRSQLQADRLPGYAAFSAAMGRVYGKISRVATVALLVPPDPGAAGPPALGQWAQQQADARRLGGAELQALLADVIAEVNAVRFYDDRPGEWGRLIRRLSERLAAGLLQCVCAALHPLAAAALGHTPGLFTVAVSADGQGALSFQPAIPTAVDAVQHVAEQVVACLADLPTLSQNLRTPTPDAGALPTPHATVRAHPDVQRPLDALSAGLASLPGRADALLAHVQAEYGPLWSAVIRGWQQPEPFLDHLSRLAVAAPSAPLEPLAADLAEVHRALAARLGDHLAALKERLLQAAVSAPDEAAALGGLGPQRRVPPPPRPTATPPPSALPADPRAASAAPKPQPPGPQPASPPPPVASTLPLTASAPAAAQPSLTGATPGPGPAAPAGGASTSPCPPRPPVPTPAAPPPAATQPPVPHPTAPPVPPRPTEPAPAPAPAIPAAAAPSAAPPPRPAPASRPTSGLAAGAWPAVESLHDIYKWHCAQSSIKPNSGLLKVLPREPGQFITEINMDYNYIGVKGMQPLLEILRVNRGLRTLNLRDNNLENAEVRALVAVLLATEEDTLTMLDLSNNPISLAGGSALMDLLSKRRRLTEVKLTGTLIQPKVREKIQELAAGNLARQQG